MTHRVAVARDAYGRGDWGAARAAFLAAGDPDELSADDLYALGDAAWWLGEIAEASATWERAYRRYLHGEQPRGAAMVALGIAVNFFLRGEEAVGGGWMSRARRLVADDPDSAEQGYVVYLLEVEARLGGIAPSDGATAGVVVTSARRVQELGHRHHDPNLRTAGLLGEGRALVKAGRVEEGLPLLDEAMVAVLADGLSPAWAGNVYCHLMAAAHELVDLRRAVAWTEATSRWLEGLPAAVLFTGICRVHRSQVHQLTGSWELAEREAAHVCRDLATIQPGSAAEGHYQIGEIRRLRGDLDRAEEAYRRAHALGRDPQPGLALLRLAQGRLEAASAAIRTALLAQVDDRLARARLCAAQVEIALAGRDLGTARQACEELRRTAADYGTPGLEVMARHATGSVLLAAGHAAEALPTLRDACHRWQAVDAPYDGARVRELLADAYDALGDAEAAARERTAAAEVYGRLGAARRGLDAGSGRVAPPPGGLTARETEVLSHVAAGRTNRQIASHLVISEKTVARHLSNIFTKLGVATRTEAAAVAFAHGLAPVPSPAPDPGPDPDPAGS